MEPSISKSQQLTPWSNVALRREDVVWDPLHEVGAVLVLDDLHLILDLLHRDLATEVGSDSEVTSVTGVGGSHHVLAVEHLLGEFGNSHGAVLLRAAGSEGCEADHEEVKTGERNWGRVAISEWGTRYAVDDVPMLTANFRRSELS